MEPAARSSVLSIRKAVVYVDGTLLLSELSEHSSLQDVINSNRQASPPPATTTTDATFSVFDPSQFCHGHFDLIRLLWWAIVGWVCVCRRERSWRSAWWSFTPSSCSAPSRPSTRLGSSPLPSARPSLLQAYARSAQQRSSSAVVQSAPHGVRCAWQGAARGREAGQRDGAQRRSRQRRSVGLRPRCRARQPSPPPHPQTHSRFASLPTAHPPGARELACPE